MSLEDDVRKCCDDIEGLHGDSQRLRSRPGAGKDLSHLDARLQRFLEESKAAREKLDTGVREGFEGLLRSWQQARDHIRGHLRLIEAKGALSSALRLAKDQYYVAAERELSVAIGLVKEARGLLSRHDAELQALLGKIEEAVASIHAQGDTAAAALDSVVAENERLLTEIDAQPV